MLTKDDLKEIRKVVREEVVAEVKDSTNNIEGQIRLSNLHLRDDVRGLDDRLKNVEVRLDNIAGDVENIISDKLKPIKKDLRYLTKTVKLIAKNYDERDVALDRRVTKIEKHLHLPENN